LEVVGDVDNRPFEAQVSPAIQQRSSDQDGCLIVKQPMPPPGRDKLGQNHCGELSVVVLSVGLI
jgi:hypothetical protein